MSCRNHPQVETGLESCYRCGFRFCEECRVEFQGHQHCAACKADAVGMLEAGQQPGPGAGGGELPPWERRQELGAMNAFWATIKAVMFDPTGFFRRMDKTVTTYDCLVVPCVTGVLGTIVGVVMNVLFQGVLAGFLASMGKGGGGEAAVMVVPQLIFGGVFILFSPVLAVLGAFLGAGFIHLYLMMTNKVAAPFHQTLRGYCYSQAPNILAVIPYLGGIVGGFWALWVSVVMVKETHRTTWGTAWMSVLWVLLILICLTGLAVGVVLVFALVAAGAR